MLSLFSSVYLCVNMWTLAYQAHLSAGFSRQECWSGQLCSPPDLSNSGIEPVSLLCLLHWQVGSLHYTDSVPYRYIGSATWEAPSRGLLTNQFFSRFTFLTSINFLNLYMKNLCLLMAQRLIIEIILKKTQMLTELAGLFSLCMEYTVTVFVILHHQSRKDLRYQLGQFSH